MTDRKHQSEIADEVDAELTRREMLKLTASAVVAVPLMGQSEALARASVSQARAPLFFTKEEFAFVDELTELIIPTDDHSPGARAAQVAAYIDRRLSESFEEEPKRQWREGLKLVDSISQEMFGRPFMAATPDQRIELLKRISQNEMNAKKPEEIFFKELKTTTARGYYTSKIGIHTEMEYKGNVSIKEFVGYDAT